MPTNSVIRLTDRPDMTIDIYHGRKITQQQQTYYLANASAGLEPGLSRPAVQRLTP